MLKKLKKKPEVGARKRRRSGRASTHSKPNAPTASPSAQPPIAEQTPDPNLPEWDWPEVKLPDMGITWCKKVHKEHYHKIKMRPIVPSGFIDVVTIEALGIKEDVKYLTKQVGLWEFLSVPVPTYKRLTLEFLSTLELNAATDRIEFQLYGKKVDLDADTINGLFNFPRGTKFDDEPAKTYVYHQGYSLPQFLDSIMAPTDANRMNQHTSHILHPAVRYIQRILGCTIFGRGSSFSKPLQAEVFVMYCMLHPEAPKPDIGHLIIQELLRAKSATKLSGQTSIGGIITKLAIATRNTRLMPWSITVKWTGKTKYTNTLNLSALQQMKQIKLVGDKLYHIAPDGSLIQLPYTVPLVREQPNTWIIPPGTGVPDNETAPPPQPTPEPFIPHPRYDPNHMPLLLGWYPDPTHLEAGASSHRYDGPCSSSHRHESPVDSGKDQPVPHADPPSPPQPSFQPAIHSSYQPDGSTSHAAGTTYNDSYLQEQIRLLTREVQALRRSHEEDRHCIESIKRTQEQILAEMSKYNAQLMARFDKEHRFNAGHFSVVQNQIAQAHTENHDHMNRIRAEAHVPHMNIDRIFRWHVDQEHIKKSWHHYKRFSGDYVPGCLMPSPERSHDKKHHTEFELSTQELRTGQPRYPVLHNYGQTRKQMDESYEHHSPSHFREGQGDNRDSIQSSRHLVGLDDEAASPLTKKGKGKQVQIRTKRRRCLQQG